MSHVDALMQRAENVVLKDIFNSKVNENNYIALFHNHSF